MNGFTIFTNKMLRLLEMIWVWQAHLLENWPRPLVAQLPLVYDLQLNLGKSEATFWKAILEGELQGEASPRGPARRGEGQSTVC